MSFLDEFQANLESLPNILQKKYSLLHDLDKSLQEIQRQNEQRCQKEIEDFKREVRAGNITPNTSLIKFSDDAVDEQKHAIRIADEKISLAAQAYDLVDTHIQQLDQYLKSFDDELRRERDSVATTMSPATSVDAGTKSGRSSEGGRGRKKSRLATATTETATAVANPTGVELDLPVDPNEPTYCFCNQVSYGEMVACDNQECKIEWFHFGCVGLKEQPKGKWYCSECVAPKNRRKGR
ncbi:hypothetical protein LWI29_024367 [Acer saccharum]|uniref:PHD finger protein ING n=1 Tax=Acer saccharum TaxID=4024 RepID=A0AA39TGN4_ACESA|nr:hypothetical protein LWI29_024367 [Acer saccharum]KAK1569063.1 hypothetical protein Q3G72_032119 [Acer saccharum]